MPSYNDYFVHILGEVVMISEMWWHCYIKVIEDPNQWIKINFSEIENGIPRMGDILKVKNCHNYFRAKIIKRTGGVNWSKEGF